MMVYRLRIEYNRHGNFKYASLTFKGDDIAAWDKVEFDCEPIAAAWAASGMQLDTLGKRLPECDFPVMRPLSGALVMTLRARDALADLLEPCGEIFELESPSRTRLFAFNALSCLDAIDHEAVEGRRLTSGRYSSVTKFAMRQDIVADADVFKIRYFPSAIYVTTRRKDNFVERYNAARLRGLEFTEVWNDEGSAIPDLRSFL